MSDVTERTRQEGAEHHSFNAEIGKVLQLMINALYTNRDIFLRELVSNASDACEKLQYLARTDDSLLKTDPELRIRIEIDKDSKTLSISDNGVGMTREELINNLGTIARSGTQEFASRLTGDVSKDVALIGQFGVGFYSAFMVAREVEVISRAAGTDKAHQWISDGSGAFTIAPLDDEMPRGTHILLHLRDGEEIYLDRHRLEHVVRTYSDHIPFPIELFDAERKKWQVLNKGSALWMRPKADISEDEHRQFYKHVSNLPDKPWMTLHNKAEGALEYTSLLYIPSIRPFDLFHPDRMRRVKLYIKRVFITDEGIDLIPPYLRFLRGVVDSEDLPLNISRETLQKNATVDKIRQAITKRIFSELKKKAEKEPEEYATFWGHFGPVLKEGLCEALSDKQQIFESCRFHSAKHTDKQISLDEYIAEMPAAQDSIYYLIGEDVEALKNSPQIEGFLSQGMDVLFFTDHVDTFWVNVANHYKEKPILSVTKVELSDEKEKGKKKAPKTSEEKKEQAELDALIAAFSETFGEDVKEVRTTAKLKDSPVCLAVGEGDMDIRMERFLVENKQLPSTSAKIFEFNPHHPVIRKLADHVSREGVSENFRNHALTLLDQARILEGEEVKNPAAFARRITALMTESL